jgi:hypothetical protein
VDSDGQSVSRYFPIFKYVAAAFDTVPASGFTLECSMASSNASGTATVNLYNKTDGTIVASATRASTTPAIVTATWSAGASNWEDGDNYEIRHKISSTSYYSRIGNAYLYITISDLKSYEIYWKISKARTAGTGALINEYQRAQLNQSNYSNESIYFEATGYCADNGNRLHLQDDGTNESGTGGANVSGADINFNSGTKARQRTASTISPDNGDRFIVDIDSSTNNLELAAAFVVFQYIPPATKSVSDSGSGSDSPIPKKRFTVPDSLKTKNILQQNLANGFEGGSVICSNPGTDCTITRDTTNQMAGSSCIKVAFDGDSYSNGWAYFGGGESFEGISEITVGEDYVFSVYVKSDNTRTQYIGVDWYNSSDTQVGYNETSFSGTTSFTRRTITSTAPTGAAYCYVYWRAGENAAINAYLDNLQFEESSSVTDYEEPSESPVTTTETLTKQEKESKAVAETRSGTDTPSLKVRTTVGDSVDIGGGSSKNILELNVANGTEDGTWANDFETSDSDCTITSVTSQKYAGNRSLSFVWETTTVSYSIGTTNTIPLEPSTDYVLSYYMTVDDIHDEDGVNGYFSIDIYDEEMGYLTTETALWYFDYYEDTAYVWKRFNVVFNSGEGATQGRLSFSPYSEDATVNHFVDCIQLEEGDTLTAYEDPVGGDITETVTKNEASAAKNITDSGTDSESPLTKNSFKLTESKALTDTPILKNYITRVDGAEAVDIPYVANEILRQDSFSVAEVLIQEALIPIIQSSSGADAPIIKKMSALLESGNASDLFSLINELTITQSGSGSDTASSIGRIGVADSDIRSGLIGYWKINEGAGNAVLDSSGYGFNGTASGGYSWVQGKRGYGMSFDGSNGLVSIPKEVYSSITNKMSICAWVKMDTLTGINTFASTFQSGGFGLTYNEPTSNRIAFRLYRGGAYHSAVSNAQPNTGEWIFLVGTYDNATIKLYVNGVLQTTTTNTTGNMTHSTQPLMLGMNPPLENPFDGSIDEVRLYNRDLTQEEVNQLYSQGFHSDDIVSQKNRFTIPQTGNGTEVLSQKNMFKAIETGSNVDTVLVDSICQALDYGSGSELLTIVMDILAQDSVTGAENLIRSKFFPVLESAHGADSPILKKIALLMDSGATTELFNFINRFTVQQAASGTEALVPKVSNIAQDSGHGTDLSLLRAFVTLSQSASATDALAIITEQLRTDNGTGSDLTSLKNKFNVTQTGSNIDALNLKNKFTIPEVKTLTDTPTLKNKFTSLDKSGAKNKFSSHQATGGDRSRSASGWSSIQGQTLIYDPTESYYGDGSIKHTNNSGSTIATFEMYTSVPFSYFKTGTQYTYTIIAKTDQTNANLRLHIERDWYFSVVDSTWFTANDWTVFSFTFSTLATAPRNARLVFFLQGQNIQNGKSVWWDSAQVEEGASFTDWEFSGITDAAIIKAIISRIEAATGTDVITLATHILQTDSLSATDSLALKDFVLLAESGSGVDDVFKDQQTMTKSVQDSDSLADALAVLSRFTVAQAGSGVELISPKKKSTVIQNPSKNIILASIACAENGWSGFQGIETHSYDDTVYLSPSTSFKCITPGLSPSEGVRWDSVLSTAPNTQYTASVYVKGSGNVKMTMVLRKSSSAWYLAQDSPIITLTNDWQRLSVTFTTPSDVYFLQMYVYTSTTQAITFWIDNCQLEFGGLTDWVRPGAVDTPYIAPKIPITQSGHGTDTTIITAHIPITQSGHGADAVVNMTKHLTVQQAGTLSDIIAGIKKYTLISDEYTAFEEVDLKVVAGIFEHGTVSEEFSFGAFLTIGDYVLGEDSYQVMAWNPEVYDSGSGDEETAIQKEFFVYDTGSGGEILFFADLLDLGDITIETLFATNVSITEMIADDVTIETEQYDEVVVRDEVNGDINIEERKEEDVDL